MSAPINMRVSTPLQRASTASVAHVKQQRKAVVAHASIEPKKAVALLSTSMAAIACSPAAQAFDRIIPDDTVPRITPTLSAFFNSLVYGGVVLGVLFGAVTFVAYYDPIRKID